VALWEDHLLPMLTHKDAARLGCTCKAQRLISREHFKDLGSIEVKQLPAALTTFPKMRTVELKDSPSWVDTDLEPLVEWLRDGGRGRGLERVILNESIQWSRKSIISEALRQGSLTSLRNLAVDLECPTHRQALTGGLLAAMHELDLCVECAEIQLAALGAVRQLPALVKLHVRLYGDGDDPVQWPAFIPPSLKTLCIDFFDDGRLSNESFLCALPSLFGASGPRLERLEVILPSFESMGDGLLHLAQALRFCSPTLKDLVLRAWGPDPDFIPTNRGDYASEVERLRVQWADVLAGVSACRELEALALPPIEVGSWFPPGTAFARLTHLEISDHEREHPPDAGVMGLWDLMASGGLPALTKLGVRLEGRWGGVEEIKTLVAPAFEAVAGTLTHLSLVKPERE
jgi:hypothetical protein